MFCDSSPKLTPEIYTSDTMQRTPKTLQPRLAAQAAAGHTTSVWQVRGVLLWLVALSEAAIRHQSSPPLSLLLCCACVCGVSRASRAAKIRIRIFGNMVKWSRCPISDLMARVRASQSSLFFSNFLFCIIMYVIQTPQTTDSTRAVQGACYNQLAKTLYTPAARQQSRKQHHTRAVVCPRCITVAF